MGKIQPQVVNVDLTLARTIQDFVVPRGTQIQTIYVADMPAAATILMAFDGKNPFRIYPGWSIDFGECNFIADGISIESPALPGDVLQLMFVPGGQGSGSFISSGQ